MQHIFNVSRGQSYSTSQGLGHHAAVRVLSVPLSLVRARKSVPDKGTLIPVTSFALLCLVWKLVIEFAAPKVDLLEGLLP